MSGLADVERVMGRGLLVRAVLNLLVVGAGFVALVLRGA